MKWYLITWVIKRGGYQTCKCYLQADNAKHAREKFDAMCYERDNKKRSFGLNPAHRFQISVKLSNADEATENFNAMWGI